jgi:hypothetical protein
MYFSLTIWIRVPDPDLNPDPKFMLKQDPKSDPKLMQKPDPKSDQKLMLLPDSKKYFVISDQNIARTISCCSFSSSSCKLHFRYLLNYNFSFILNLLSFSLKYNQFPFLLFLFLPPKVIGSYSS